LGIPEGLDPAGDREGVGGTGKEEAPATMYERGTAVGFCDTKEKEGVGRPETEEPETLEPETLAPEEAAEPEGVEAAEGALVEEVVLVVLVVEAAS